MAALKSTLAVFWFVCMALARPAYAAPALKLDDAPPVVNLTPYIEVFEDPEAQFGQGSLLDVGAIDGRFHGLQGGAANYGFSHSDWWVRFTVSNDDGQPKRQAFFLDYPLLDYVDVWVFRGNEQLQAWKTGNRRVFSTRPVAHRDFLFPLSVSGHEQQTIYMRIRTEGPVNIGLRLQAEQTLLSRIELEYMAFGGYFGGFLLLALAITLLFLFDRQAAYLYYLAYILSYSSYMLTFNGLAFQYLWPDNPDFGQVIRPVLLTLSLIFLLQFSRTLLGLSKISPALHRIVTGLQTVLALVLLAVPFLGYGPLVEPLAVLNMAAFLAVIAMGIVAHMSGERAARYYLAAWSIFLVGVIVYLLKVFGFLPHNFLTHYGFQVGSFFEFLFLSAALGVRLKELRRLSNDDALTGLANRRSFDTALAQEFTLSNRPEAELSLLVIDVDHFKHFNDRYGHAEGDTLLKELAQVFQSQIRRPGMAFRYGGEEFAVLLPRTGPEAAYILAERLRERVSIDLSYRDISISIGVVSHVEGRFETADAFFIAGDRALYRAKDAGRNRVVAYEAAPEGAETASGGTAGGMPA